MNNFLDILKTDYQKWANRPFVYEKKQGEYQASTFGDIIEKAVYLAEALLALGLANQNVAICGPNSVKWMIADLAVMSFVGSSTGLSPRLDLDALSTIIKRLNAKAIIYDASLQAIINQVKPSFNDVIFISMADDFDVLIEKGTQLNKKRADLLDFAYRPTDIFVKGVLTAGSTGAPKIVMLSQQNIFYGWPFLKRRAAMNSADVCYLFLPLYHTYGAIYNFIYALISGMQIYLSSAVSNIVAELSQVKPTVFCAVPIIYLNIYNEAKNDIGKVFGNNIKYLFTAGSKLDAGIVQFYRAAGLNLMAAYALSETASSLAIDYPYEDNPACQGTVFEGLDVIVDRPDQNGYGEILVKGDNLFLGYYGDESATKNSFNEAGYFMTGDIGKLDQKQRIFISARKDDLIVSANGKKYTSTSWKQNTSNL